ncbi:MAG: MinD/ParA family protein [bacterium]|nr:MinD/ParA family protein [bacterium]
MKWEQALQLLRFGQKIPTERTTGPALHCKVEPDPLGVVRATSICVVSGKGGTGKSLVSASLANLLARRARTLVVDADFGVGNAHILQDASPQYTVVDVVEGRRDLREVVHTCGEQLDLLAGGSGYARMAGLTPYELHLIAGGLEKLELSYRYVLVDSAAGVSSQTVALAAASDVTLLVTTPDVTAMTDAYAFLKVFLQRKPVSDPLLVVNRATSAEEAEATAKRILGVSQKFLGRQPRWVATLPEDRAAFRCTQRRSPVVVAEPDSELGLALQELAAAVDEEVGRSCARGIGRTLLQRVGYSPKSG